MNKTAIKNFAIWARKKLMSDIRTRLGFVGITENGIATALESSTKDIQYFESAGREPLSISGADITARKRLAEQLDLEARQGNYKTAYESLVENTASAWFNRLIAIRFMEINGYLSDGIRMLSSVEAGKQDPDIVTSPFDSDLEFSDKEREEIVQAKISNETDKVFRILFFERCHKLHRSLPGLFEDKGDATEFLMRLSVIDTDGVIYHLVHDIAEEDFNVSEGGQVEIIGWMYQYYNTEPKNQIINVLKGSAIQKEDIPAATQLFTTDWVVRYIVDNTVGRYWIERHPESHLADRLIYFVRPKNGEIKYVNEKVNPEELTILDNCMGSGHFLVYAIEVLMYIYDECGYDEQDAIQMILDNNISGLDIDQRAYQLAYFAVMMKARQYDRRILSRGIMPKLYAIEESNLIRQSVCLELPESAREIAAYLCKAFRDAKEYGSIIRIVPEDYKKFVNTCEEWLQSHDISFDNYAFEKDIVQLIKLAKQASVISKKYVTVVTNPPYMNRFDDKVKRFITEYYKDYSGDLFSVFMKQNIDSCKKNGYAGFMTPYVWMFLKTYEKLRDDIINNKSIVSLIQMEYSAFEEATVPICSFVIKNEKEVEKGLYFRLTDFRGGMEVQKKKTIEAIQNPNCKYFYESFSANFVNIPTHPIAYWIGEKYYQIFKSAKLLGELADSKQGIATADNNTYLRLWSEVNVKKVCFDCRNHEEALVNEKKWFPYNKGGQYRKWYGNNDYLVNWEKDGNELRHFKRAVLRNPAYYFRESGTWSDVTSSVNAFRYKPVGFLFDVAGMSFFSIEMLHYLIALCNTKIAVEILKIVAPTLHCQCGDVANIPVKIAKNEINILIENLTRECIELCREDWDCFEYSWDFKRHPLVELSGGLWDVTAIGASMHYYYGGHPEVSCPLELCFMLWQGECNERFKKLKNNEEELNRIFIDIYGLQDELTPEVEDKDVTVRKADLGRDIRSFLSYAIGCMFGRYSLAKEGLAYAGGEWTGLGYGDFEPDADNIIPILDTAYFEDDIVKRIEEFLKVVFDEASLESNLEYIAKALDEKSIDARKTIRDYFLNDFFKDHCTTYSVTGSGKRPIYWLFDSGKQNGFKALVYMHRWNADIEARVRALYLHKVQEKYENEVKAINTMIEHMTDNRLIAKEEKRKDKLLKQIAEVKEYDEILDHIANEHIDIDLDDGVKVNYERVQTDHNGKKYNILAPIK